MKKVILTFLGITAFCFSYAQLNIPQLEPMGGPLNSRGSLLNFLTGDNTSIQENWGLNICGMPNRPVRVFNASLLVGYTNFTQDYGLGNAFISGNVGIGTSDPKGYKLAVNGNIRAREIKVETQNWPDYVFDPSNVRPSLEEVKTFIDKNKHLPDIPSAKEVDDQGVGLGEMNVKLLKKVEELTLYLIEQNERLQKQEKLIQSLISKSSKKNNSTF